MATNDELTRDTVKNFLSHPDVYKVKGFQMGLVYFHPTMFVGLIALIEIDKLHVKFAALTGKAGYIIDGAKGNTLEFSFTTAVSLSQKALILHEATHALLDLIMAPGMKVEDSEAMAYIVQCQYARANNEAAGTRLMGSGKEEDKVFKMAWTIAGRILKGKKPKKKEYEKLKEAIGKHPEYSANHKDTVNWDGIS